MAQLGPDEMTSLVWAGLLHKFPNMTLDEVSDIIDDYLEEHTMEDLLEVVMSTIKESSIFRRPDMGETPTVSHTPMTEATENKKKNMKHSTT